MHAESLDANCSITKCWTRGARLYGEGSGFEEAPVEFSGKESGFISVNPGFGWTAPPAEWTWGYEISTL
jgi:hypothetical protein